MAESIGTTGQGPDAVWTVRIYVMFAAQKQ